MNKILLIIQREYFTRIRKKSFIVMLFLVPGLIVAMYAILSYVAKNDGELNRIKIVNVKDDSGLFAKKLHDKRNIKFAELQTTIKAAKADLQKNEDNLLLVIGADYTGKNAIQVYSKKKPGLEITEEIENQVNDIATTNVMVKSGIDTAKLSAIKKAGHIDVHAKEVTDKGDTDANVGAAYAAGIAGAILIYLSLFIYGAQVMRGVIEEKTSRIIEVIISSVKPFQLMMGKIIGVGLVGLTQFLLWILLSTAITYIAGHYFTVPASPVITFMKSMGDNVGYELSCFMFYWLSGFLLYSALFAAVGSAVDSETETQQFMFPITLPLLFTYILSVSFLFRAPDSPLAVWLSIIPFTAPVAMMVRLPFNVPGWQLALSMCSMVIGFLFTTWVASRIYRVGILMYGKKVNFKELAKWFFYKE